MGTIHPTPDNLKDVWDFNLTNHTPTPEAQRKIEHFRTTAKAMANAIIEFTPQSREQSIALTKLEEMSFFAIAAIVRNNIQEEKEK